MDADLAAAKYVLDLLTPAEMIEVGLHLVLVDSDSTTSAVSQLAGLTKSEEGSARELFLRALMESRTTLPSESEAVRVVALDGARSVAKGDADPLKMAALMWRLWDRNRLDYLTPFVNALDDYQSTAGADRQALAIEDIKRYAETLLSELG